jgi:flagellar biosynthesis/type III secretory pathway protein FliH
MSFVTVSDVCNKTFVQTVLAQDTADLAAQEAEIARRVRQEVAKLREKAETESREAGLLAARAEMAPLRAELDAAVAALQAATIQLATPLAQKERDLAALVTELAFLLARHIIGAEAGCNIEGLHTLVTTLLEEAAAERGPRQTLQLRLNPADHAQIAPLIGTQTAQLIADEKIAPGGAVAELSSPEGDPLDKIEWDATLQGRADAIRNALGLPEGMA